MLYHAEKLENVNPILVKIITKCAETQDIIIITGHRNKEAQDECYKKGTSMCKFPDSKHNSSPSKAFDAAISTDRGASIDWRNLDNFHKLNREIQKVAKTLGVKIKWGGEFKSIRDFVHWELI